MKKQHGFSVIEALLVLAVLVIIGVVGYLAYVNFVAPKTDNAADTTASSTPVKVESKEDLNKADTALDDVTLDDSDSSQLDSATNTF